MGDLTNILLIFVAALGVGGMVYGMATRSERIVREWAVKNGLDLEEAEFRMFRKGPFWFSGRGQVVYRVAARDAQGRLRRGWVRCGGFLLGVMENKVEARWDD